MDTPSRLEQHVRQIVKPGGRIPGTRQHETTREYLESFLQRAGLMGYWNGRFSQEYESDQGVFTNILAMTPPTKPDHDSCLIVAAHYDTCGPTPGADDNAAAVAIVMDVAESLSTSPLPIPVAFAFFDAEEPPYYLTSSMGSIRFYREQNTRPIHSAIVLDLCGHDVPLPGLEHALFITGMESSPTWVKILKTCVPETPLGVVTTLNRYIGDMSDHHIFRVENVPYLFMSCGRWKYYHDVNDTPEKLNYEKMAKIRDFLLRILKETSKNPLIPSPGHFDPIDTELEFLQRAAGPLLKALGVSPRTRKDMDSLAQLFIGELGL